MKKLKFQSNILIIVICAVLLFNLQAPSYCLDDQKTKDFWDSLSSENYEQALNIAFEKGYTNAVYFEIAYYLEIISFHSRHLLHQINEEIRAGKIDSQKIKEFENEMKQYLEKDSPFMDMTQAIIEFNEHNQKATAIKLVSKALSKKETTLGYYLHFAFQGNQEALKKAAELSKLPGFLNQYSLILSFNNNQMTKDEMLTNLEKLLASDDYYFDQDDYRNYIQMGLGKRFVSGIGPSGPDGEPYFGELCQVTAWDSFKKFAPRHQVLFAFAVGGPGGQNTGDAEKLLTMIDEKTQQTYAPFVKMLRIYEDFHDYQYPDVFQGANELLAMELNDPVYFTFVYDLAYEYEMFYFKGYHAEQPMIEKAVQLYEKAYQLAPERSSYWKECVLQGKGRSQFYAGAYRESIDTLNQALTLQDDPLCFMFLSLDYYAIKDSKNGAFWETKSRKAFTQNRNILNQFDELLKDINNK